jgi:hypothetical protein
MDAPIRTEHTLIKPELGVDSRRVVALSLARSELLGFHAASAGLHR